MARFGIDPHLRYRLILTAVLAAPIVVLVAIAFGVWFFLIKEEDTTPPGARDYITGLPAPAGLSLGLGGLVITSLGSGQNDGAIYRALIDGDRATGSDITKLVEALPSRSASGKGPPFLPVLGPTAAVDEGGQSIGVIVSGSGKPFGTIYRAPLQPGAPAGEVADLAAFAIASGARSTGSTPFAAVRDGNGVLYVSDPLAGMVFRVTAKGEVSIYTDFGQISPPLGDPFASFPTGIAIGPGNAIYVSLFSGDPYRPERSRIYRLQDRNADGDAADAGERTIAADGLSFCVGLALTSDGVLYALEYTTSLDDPSGRPVPGRLWRLGERSAALIADDLVTPVSLVIDSRGRAFIAERDTGKVRMLADVGIAADVRPAAKRDSEVKAVQSSK